MIATWSGPRNLSSAMMRSFGNRSDCVVRDEPFYAAFLAESGIDHPMRQEIMAAGETDWREVVRQCMTPPKNAAVCYQKHMAHHMLTPFDCTWIVKLTNVFLIREPERVVASYQSKRDGFTLDDLGYGNIVALFDLVANHHGSLPPVIDATDIRADPAGMLSALCAAIGIPFDEAMLSWPPGLRPTDGRWATHWYDRVAASTGFAPPEGEPPDLSAAGRRVADEARPLYDRIAEHRLKPAPQS